MVPGAGAARPGAPLPAAAPALVLTLGKGGRARGPGIRSLSVSGTKKVFPPKVLVRVVKNPRLWIHCEQQRPSGTYQPECPHCDSHWGGGHPQGQGTGQGQKPEALGSSVLGPFLAPVSRVWVWRHPPPVGPSSGPSVLAAGASRGGRGSPCDLHTASV